MTIPPSSSRASALFPAGIPSGLVRAKRRILAILEDGRGPLVFLGVVLSVAVLFRAAVDALRPHDEPDKAPAPSSLAAAEPSAPAAVPAHAASTSVPSPSAAEPGQPALGRPRSPRSFGAKHGGPRSHGRR